MHCRNSKEQLQIYLIQRYFIDTINLQEAQASSAIENIITTEDELFKASVSDKLIDNPATKEVIHYKNAHWYA